MYRNDPDPYLTQGLGSKQLDILYVFHVIIHTIHSIIIILCT